MAVQSPSERCAGGLARASSTRRRSCHHRSLFSSSSWFWQGGRGHSSAFMLDAGVGGIDEGDERRGYDDDGLRHTGSFLLRYNWGRKKAERGASTPLGPTPVRRRSVSTNIPYGYCHCGCGEKTAVAPTADHRWGYAPGEPYKFKRGHQNRKSPPAPDTPKSAADYRRWWSEHTDVAYGYCWCGCGERTRLSKRSAPGQFQFRGEPKRYLNGHSGAAGRTLTFVEGVHYRVEDRGYDTPCWIWLRRTDPVWGYGSVRYDGRNHLAHRLSWERTCGPIPQGKQMHHKCETPACIRVGHLEIVTPLEHQRRHRAMRAD